MNVMEVVGRGGAKGRRFGQERRIALGTLFVLGLCWAGTAGAFPLSEDEALKVARETLAKLSLRDKVKLCAGTGYSTYEKVPGSATARPWRVSDSSGGLQADVPPDGKAWPKDAPPRDDKSTCGPGLSALAATWDPSLAWRHGDMLGAEMRDREIDQLLGPGINVMRTPLCGRNWEYLSEDPFLAGVLAAQIIRGVQGRDVAAMVKHFAANNQEWGRYRVDTMVDDRTLREIYLSAFERAFREGGSLGTMTCYNKINGIHGSENAWTQNGILREEWGFLGPTTSDWGGHHSTAAAALGGGTIEMNARPGITHYVNHEAGTYPLEEAVKKGEVPLATLDDMVLHTLYMMARTGFLTGAPRAKGERNTERNKLVARTIGEDSIVLLKNGKGVLPLEKAKTRKLLVIGAKADQNESLGGSSACGNPPYEISYFKGLKEYLGDKADVTLEPLPLDAKADRAAPRARAEAADAVIVYTGTEHGAGGVGCCESEGSDRCFLTAEPAEDAAVAEILGWKVPHLVIACRSGAPVAYSWTDRAPTVLQHSYLRQEGGRALARVVFGEVNPSGRLPCTWPRDVRDTPSATCGTYNNACVTYNERFYVGYRWYDARKIPVRWPFGYGLSYTTFKWGRPTVKQTGAGTNAVWTVKVPVTNTGTRDGKEVVQLYARPLDAKVERCVKELRGFAKVSVKAGATAVAEIAVKAADLRTWDAFAHRWRVDDGRYELLAAANAEDVRGKVSVTVRAPTVPAAASAAAFPLPDAEAHAQAEAALAHLTLDEKTKLCAGNSTMTLPAIPSAGITAEWRMSDGSHGIKPEHRRESFGYVEGIDDRSTALPPLSALACTWNPSLAQRHGRVMGEQMRARGVDQMLGPGINVMRNPLCGRNWEYLSEDPHLIGALAAPLVRGVQAQGVAATVKHFAVNGQELDRNAVDTVVDDRTLNEIYLPGFRAAIREGGALAVMTAYNKVNGYFCSENAYLQKTVLRDRWGFTGEIVTDWGGQHSCAFAANNGGNVEMSTGRDIKYFHNPFHEGESPLAAAVRNGEVAAATVDEMALHTLYMMAKTGFLDNRARPGERFDTPRGADPATGHAATARAIGEEAIVLLKNAKGVLPLDKAKTKRVVVAGLAADRAVAHLGSSCESHPPYEITALAGLKEYLGKDAQVDLFPLGAETSSADRPAPIDPQLVESFDPTDKTHAFNVRAWKVEYFKDKDCRGTPHRTEYVKGPDLKWTDCQKPGSHIPDGTGVRVSAKVRAPETGDFNLAHELGPRCRARIRVDGKLLSDLRPGHAGVWAALEKGRVYEIALEARPSNADEHRIFFGWVPPSARRAGVAKLKEACAKADAVVVFTGTSIGFGRALECEGGDRPDLRTPDGHDGEIAEILSWNFPNTVVVNRSGSPMEFPWEGACATLVHQPYLGQEAGRPLARVLFGEVNPSGRLACTWPRRYEDTPVARCGTYQAGRVILNERFYVGYRWYDARKIAPMFPFGHGLGYTTFVWGKPSVAKKGDGWVVRVPVRNTGRRAGKETVQLYVHAVSPEVERCVKELKGFAKVEVPAGGEATAEIPVSPRDLAYWDSFRSRFRADKGDYELIAAASAADVRGAVRVTLPAAQHFAD